MCAMLEPRAGCNERRHALRNVESAMPRAFPLSTLRTEHGASPSRRAVSSRPGFVPADGAGATVPLSRPRRTCRAIRASLAVVTALALLAATGAGVRAEVKNVSASGFTIENTRVVPVDAGTAFKALVDSVDRWWPKDHTWWGKEGTLSIEPRAGGCFCERAGSREALHMLVTFVDPGQTLRMTGGLGPLQAMGLHGALEFRFAPAKEGGTAITLYYRAGGYTPDDLSELAPVVDKVQGMQLGGLAEFLGVRPSTNPK